MSGFIFLAAESTLSPHECEISRTKNTSVSVTNDNLRRANKVNWVLPFSGFQVFTFKVSKYAFLQNSKQYWVFLRFCLAATASEIFFLTKKAWKNFPTKPESGEAVVFLTTLSHDVSCQN